MTNKSRHYQCVDLCAEIFRAYDIRGIVGAQINTDVFYTIGRAISVALHQQNRAKVVIGHDDRLESPGLSNALCQGLLDSGISVIDIGEIPTPVLYFSTHLYDIDSGLIVTGSHNAKEYNGLKIVLAGRSLSQNEIINIHKISQSQQQIDAKNLASYEERHIHDDYIQYICAEVKIPKSIKVVIDCGNGVAGNIAPRLFRDLGCHVVELFCEADGRFPNHHPDPSVPENLSWLIESVKKNKANIGIAFDGDADRIGVVTNQGKIIPPDKLMVLFSREILLRKKGSKIIFDVKCSKVLAEEITKHGGIPLLSATGHSIVKKMMRETNAELGGELSGHIFFKDRWFGFDDAMYSGARLIEILSNSNLSSHSLFDDIPELFNTPEYKIPFPEKSKFQFIDKLKENVKFAGAEINYLDGLRIEFQKGWCLIRASNTSPYVIVRFEAESQSELSTLKNKIGENIRSLYADIELPF